MQSRIFLERIFEPYMDGLMKVWGVSPEEGLRILIEAEAPIGKIAKDNPEALAQFMNQPEMKIISAITSPIGDLSDDWVKDKMAVLLDVMAELRPELARGILEIPGGQEWFYESLTGLRDILFRSQR